VIPGRRAASERPGRGAPLISRRTITALGLTAALALTATVPVVAGATATDAGRNVWIKASALGK
jgi:hypothetical protein